MPNEVLGLAIIIRMLRFISQAANNLCTILIFGSMIKYNFVRGSCSTSTDALPAIVPQN